MIKLTLVLLTLAICLSNSTAWIRHYHSSSSRCIDCWGRYRFPGSDYFDGCNWCRCEWGPFGPRRAGCTLMYCEYNQCFKPRRN